MGRKRKDIDIPLEEVIRLYREERWSGQRIGDKFAVHSTTIFRWLRDANVESRSRGRKTVDLNRKLLPAQFKDLYYRRKFTLSDIAKELGVGRSSIHRWFEKFNIPRRPRGHWSKREQIP